MGCGASTVAPEPPNPTATTSAPDGKKSRARRASVEIMVDAQPAPARTKSGKERTRRASIEIVRAGPSRLLAILLPQVLGAISAAARMRMRR